MGALASSHSQTLAFWCSTLPGPSTAVTQASTQFRSWERDFLSCWREKMQLEDPSSKANFSFWIKVVTRAKATQPEISCFFQRIPSYKSLRTAKLLSFPVCPAPKPIQSHAAGTSLQTVSPKQIFCLFPLPCPLSCLSYFASLEIPGCHWPSHLQLCVNKAIKLFCCWSFILPWVNCGMQLCKTWKQSRTITIKPIDCHKHSSRMRVT